MAVTRAARYTLVGLAVVIVLLVLLVVVLTRTEYGVERSGRVAVDQLRGMVNGELQVERFTSGGLLAGVTLHGVAIDGPDGRPFLRADSARLAYRFRTLLGGAIVFDRLILHSPDVVIERLPGDDTWNYDDIFASDTAEVAGPRRVVLISDVLVTDGHATVRMPWEPEGPVAPADTARMILESVPGGIVRTMRFAEINGRIPRIVWEAPEEEGRLVEVGELATRAYIYETPMDIESLEGVVVIRDSLVSFQAPRVRLPGSELAAVGTIILDEVENRYDIQIEGPDVAFSDFQWLYPPLPRDGGGTLQLRIQTQEPGSILWLARNARLRTGGSEVAGSFGVVTGDTLYFTNVALEASPLDLDLLQQLVPTELPIEGLLIGTIEVEGPISALDTRGDVRLRTFRGGAGAESELRWEGRLSGRRPFRVSGMIAEVRELDLDQVAQFTPGLRLRGLATGRIRASGSLEAGLDLTGDLALSRDGHRSAVRGSGIFAAGGDRSAFDLRLEAEPLALELLVEQFPGLGRLAGEARGPVEVTGTIDDFRIAADMLTPAGGVQLHGRFALRGSEPRYRAEGAVSEFQLHRLLADLPETVVTGRFDIDGAGDRPETVDARASVRVLSANVAGVEIRPSALRGTVVGGMLRLDSAFVATEVGDLTATGTFGIVEGRSGDLSVTASASALDRLEPIFFPEASTAGLAGERLVTGPTARLGGAMEVVVTVVGSVHDWAARGHAGGRNLLYDGVQAARAEADFDWRPDTVTIDGSVDSVSYQHRRLPHARATVGWSPSGGRLVAVAAGTGSQRLDLEGAFDRVGEDVELRLRQLDLTTDDGRWAVTDTVYARVGLGGVQVDSLVLLRRPRYARVTVAGALPWRRPEEQGSRPASLVVSLDSVPIGEVLRVAQSDTTIDGVASGEFRVTGTALAPEMAGWMMARPFRYGSAVLDSAGAELGYGDRLMRTRFAGWAGGESIVIGSGTIPVDLALTDRDDRLPDEPVDFRVQANSVPAGLVSFLAPGFRDLSGTVDGELAIVGTTRDPGLEGELHLVGGSALFQPLNVRYHAVNATARMGAGRLVDIDAKLSTGAGAGHVLGTVDLTRPSDPGLDLAVTARELDATRRRDVVAVATGRARVTGSYVRPVVSGDVRIVSGEMNLDEIWRQYQIIQLDPALFHLFDSTAISFRPPAEIPFLENLVLTDATITADRGFWLRSRELNVEVSGSLDLEVDRQVGDLRLTGALEALGGNYTLQLAQGVPGRTFSIRGGTIEFVGTPGIDPGLNMAAAYSVRRSQGDPIDVLAQVTGTLKDPRVGLTSDSDLPLSESDLASYILFGRSGAELSQAESDVLSSGIGLVRPVATGMLSNMAQDALAWTGLVDYVAFTAPEYGLTEWNEGGLGGVLHNTQLEIGIDAGRDVSLVVSGRLRTDDATMTAANALWRQVGARVEWRFRPTWTTELYVEDRFARTPSFGLTEIDDRKVWGLSLVRDWGY